MKKYSDDALVHLAAYQQKFTNLCEQLKRVADSNPDGFTAKVVLNEVVKINPKKGYIVALGITQNVSAATAMAVQADLQENLKKIYQLVGNPPQVLMGGWEHEDIYFYDVVLRFEDFEVAMGFAKANAQIAIWDCEKQVSIHL